MQREITSPKGGLDYEEDEPLNLEAQKVQPRERNTNTVRETMEYADLLIKTSHHKPTL